MTLSDRFIELPQRLHVWHKWLIALGLYAAATGLRAAILPADGIFLFGTYYPTVIFVYFLCGRWIGTAFVVAGITTAMLLFTPPEKTDAPHLIAGYLLSLGAGVVIGEFFRVLGENAAELRATRARYQGIVEAQKEWVLRGKADGSLTYANPAAIAALGAHVDGHAGAKWPDLVYAEDLPDVVRRLAPLSPENPVIEMENRVYNARGEAIWGHFSTSGVFDASGQLIEIQTVARDVTERRQLRETLQDLAGELADLYQNAPCGYYSINADGVILKANVRLLEWLGAPAEEVVGKARLPDFFDEEGKRRFEEDLPRFLQTGRLADTEHNLVSRDGTVRRVSISANGQFDAQHRFLQSRSIMVDITDRKRAEQELQRFNAELESRVADRTADLMRAHRELETFSYSVSHDLRAPLRAVNGLAAIILEDHGAALPAECIRLVERIRDAGLRMSLLVDVLLSLSRLELGQIPDDTVDHEPLVRDIFAELQSLDGESPATLVVQPLQPCRAQPALLRQVWHNLLSNAMKHSRHRPDARIEVGCDTSGRVPVYYVRDNGEGFDMRYAGKLFQMFERLQADGSREGHGVGLAIVRRIVERHGGRVWAESKPGEGATFSFTLAPEASAT